MHQVVGSRRRVGRIRVARAHHRRERLGEPVDREATVGRRGVEARGGWLLGGGGLLGGHEGMTG